MIVYRLRLQGCTSLDNVEQTDALLQLKWQVATAKLQASSGGHAISIESDVLITVCGARMYSTTSILYRGGAQKSCNLLDS